jgi:hypothetical protein
MRRFRKLFKLHRYGYLSFPLLVCQQCGATGSGGGGGEQQGAGQRSRVQQQSGAGLLVKN